MANLDTLTIYRRWYARKGHLRRRLPLRGYPAGVSEQSLSRAELARAGFRDPLAAQRPAHGLRLSGHLLDAVSASADPDLALASLSRLDAVRPSPLASARTDLRRWGRLVAVLGSSAALGDFVVRHPEAVRQVSDEAPAPRDAGGWRTSALEAVGADPGSPAPAATRPDTEAVSALRIEYRTRLLQVCAEDLTSGWTVEEVAASLADLAAAMLEGALAISRARLGEVAASCRLAVIALGKTGGGELNYASDVDVVFVHEPAPGASAATSLDAAQRLAAATMQVCSVHTTEGALWEVDAALRPEGSAGPLVRTLASHLAYYRRWARTWEFQALLKARPVAGDVPLGEAYVDAVAPLVWSAADRDGFVPEVQAMRRRVIENLPSVNADRQLKLGPGGLRDVEFAVQLLQLVHGRSDERLRSRTTLTALAALTDGGYVGRDDGAALADAYRFLRCLEHRIQLMWLRRVHVVPTRSEDLRRLGRSFGYREDPAGELDEAWRRNRRDVRRLHEKLFYRPVLAAVAAVPGEGMRLAPEAASARLTALGYADPQTALGHLQALTSGLTRRAAIQRQLLPVLLRWFADGPDPDAALLAFRTLSERLGGSPWYLRQLRDESLAAEQLARVLSHSRFATGLLALAPEAVAMLGSQAELTPRPAAQLRAEAEAVVRRHAGDPAAAFAAVRALRRRELSRVAMADVLHRLDVEPVGQALSDITLATLGGALEAATAAVAATSGPLPTRLAIVAMGRLGGQEMSYGSDADVMFVHEPAEGASEREASEAALAVAQRLRELLVAPGDDPPLHLDADLRPEGKQGPLVRSLAAHAAYYERWAALWERQALLRADAAIGAPGLCERFTRLIEALRWPVDGLLPGEVTELRRIKARVDSERLPRGADPATHLKLGRGGLGDVEWTVQLLQLQHAGSIPALRTTRTLPALRAAAAAGLLPGTDAAALEAAWLLVSRIRNAITVVAGRPSDTLPRDGRNRAGVADLLGYGIGGAEPMVDDYRRVTRRARSAFERVFGGR